MATVLSKYTHTHRRFAKSWDWDNDTFSIRLLTSGYTYSAAHTDWTSCSSYELSESGTNYTAGGIALVCSSSNTLLSATDVVFEGLTATFRQGVLVREGTADGVTNALVAHFLWDNTGGGTDIVLANIDFLIRFSSGLFTL